MNSLKPSVQVKKELYKPEQNWASTTPTGYYIYYVRSRALLSTLCHYSVMKQGKFVTVI